MAVPPRKRPVEARGRERQLGVACGQSSNAGAKPDGSSNSLLFASCKTSPGRSVPIAKLQLTVRRVYIFVNRKPRPQ